MARNTIQKKITSTTVKGFTIEDGKPVEVEYKLTRKCGLNTAQARIRKDDPSFSAVSIEETETLYVMSLDKFIENAEVIEG